MLKNIKDLSNLIKLENQLDITKSSSDQIIYAVLKIINEESGLKIKEKDILNNNNNNIFKIKLNSNKRFIILMHLEKINKKIKNLNSSLTLEL